MAWPKNPVEGTHPKQSSYALQLKIKALFKLIKVYPYGAVELLDERTGQEFKVNGHIVKHYMGAVATHPNEDLFLRDRTS